MPMGSNRGDSLRTRDLDEWRRWSQLRTGIVGLLRRFKASRSVVPDFLYLPTMPRILVVVDVWSASCRAAVGAVIARLDPDRTAILAAMHDDDFSVGRQRTEFDGPETLPESIEKVVTLGSYLRLGGAVEPWAKAAGRRYYVVQHGLITPWAPPLSPGDHLLAWSAADAAYWSDGRDDVTATDVGSQMMWEASHLPAVEIHDECPLLLGQLHGIELSRSSKRRIYVAFSRGTGATYRPHPNEIDALSRLEHRIMRRQGVVFDTEAGPLVDVARPIVSIFSTGTLEAAQRGLPAYVYHPDPPDWVRGFWRRYGLHEWGATPTPRYEVPDREPAQTIIEVIS